MKIFLSLLLIFFTLTNCKSQSEELSEESNYNSNSPSLKSVLNEYQKLQKELDYILEKDSTKMELYLQENENNKIKRVPNFDETPESFYSSFNLIRNSKGIVYIAEFPNSESGDWFIIYESFFDGEGNLIAFVRKCSFFNGECAEIVHEKSEYFFDKSHNLIKKTYTIEDENKKKLDFKKCVFNYRDDYNIYHSLKEYLKKHTFEM